METRKILEVINHNEAVAKHKKGFVISENITDLHNELWFIQNHNPQKTDERLLSVH